MSEKLITVEDFRSSAKRGTRPDGTVIRAAEGKPKMVDEGGRKIRFCFSDGSVDRAGDVIEASGWDLTAFNKNPIALWAHDSFSPPIGRASEVQVEGNRLMGTIEFMPAEISGFADSIFRMVKAGYLSATSVGFLPEEYEWANDDDRKYGLNFIKQELLEISVVPVPCNANALAQARAKGIDTRPLVEWAEKTLDGGGKVIIPRAELERLRKAAKEPASMSTRPNPGARRRDPSGMSETDPAEGGGVVATCGRKAEDECLFKDPAQCSVHGEDKALTAAEIRQILRDELKRLAPRRRDAADGDPEPGEHREPDGDEMPEGHEERVRAAHAHVKAADALYGAADEHHESAMKCLGKAVDGLDDPEAEKAEGEGGDEDDGTDEQVRAAHAHMKSAADLTDQAEEHHDKAIELLGKAVDDLANPEAEDGGKAARLRRAKAHKRRAARAS